MAPLVLRARLSPRIVSSRYLPQCSLTKNMSRPMKNYPIPEFGLVATKPSHSEARCSYHARARSRERDNHKVSRNECQRGVKEMPITRECLARRKDRCIRVYPSAKQSGTWCQTRPTPVVLALPTFMACFFSTSFSMASNPSTPFS